jgi:hypothetical protein
LGYYASQASKSSDAASAQLELALWFIKNHPASAVSAAWEARHFAGQPNGYDEAKRLWIENVKVHDRDAKVLGHAATFFSGDAAVHEALLRQAQKLKPNSAEWSGRLGHFYRMSMIRSEGGERREFAAKALAEVERTLEQRKAAEANAEYHLLDDLATLALEAGDLDKADRLARRLLKINSQRPKNGNTGNAVHYGNLVLGRVALRKGRVAEAKARLLAAGKTTGSPTLSSFGPNMALAKELLEKGEKEVVLEYFELCAKFWDPPQLKEWTATVEKGEIPEFRGNLVY